MKFIPILLILSAVASGAVVPPSFLLSAHTEGVVSRQVVPVQTGGNVSLISVVLGFGGVYWNGLSQGTWSDWGFLSGSTSSAPALCQSGSGSAQLVVRGLDDGIYHKSFSNGSWTTNWDSPGGSTIDQPACAVLNNVLYIAVRGIDNGTWLNSMSLTDYAWSSWVDLGGVMPSTPVLVATPNSSRLDLIVRGMDDGIYHKSFVNSTWSSTWDFPGGVTPSVPAAVSNGTALQLVVRGFGDHIWYNSMDFTTDVWSGWLYLGGETPSAPAIAIDELGTLHVVVRGEDDTIWHKAKPLGESWSSVWDSSGGRTPDRPVLDPSGLNLNLLVMSEGNATQEDNILYNSFVASTWQSWTNLDGQTTALPSLSSV